MPQWYPWARYRPWLPTAPSREVGLHAGAKFYCNFTDLVAVNTGSTEVRNPVWSLGSLRNVCLISSAESPSKGGVSISVKISHVSCASSSSLVCGDRSGQSLDIKPVSRKFST